MLALERLGLLGRAGHLRNGTLSVLRLGLATCHVQLEDEQALEQSVLSPSSQA